MKTAVSSIKRGIVIGLGIALVLIGGRSIYFLATGSPFFQTLRPLPVYGQIPQFELTDSSGERFGLQQLKEQVWIADFIFTRCAGPCPVMSLKMKKIQDEFAGTKGIRLISFSVDPEYDTEERLAEYAARFQADTNTWKFLTGDKDAIFRLSQQHFYLGAGEIPEAEQKIFSHRIHHSNRFVLVDRKAEIRGYYDSSDPKSLDQLIRDTRSLI